MLRLCSSTRTFKDEKSASLRRLPGPDAGITTTNSDLDLSQYTPRADLTLASSATRRPAISAPNSVGSPLTEEVGSVPRTSLANAGDGGKARSKAGMIAERPIRHRVDSLIFLLLE